MALLIVSVFLSVVPTSLCEYMKVTIFCFLWLGPVIIFVVYFN